MKSRTQATHATSPEAADRISQYDTPWTQVIESHDAQSSEAQRYILEYYGPCAFDYLKNLTRDRNLATDLIQEFALRFLQGDYRAASPDRGRFRDYLKTVLRNLFYEHCRRQKKEKLVAIPEEQLDAERVLQQSEQFDDDWRTVILGRTWERLKQYQTRKSNLYYTVLKLRAEHPQLDSSDLAALTSKEIDRDVNRDWVRQQIKRSRDKFSEFLSEEVAKTLETPDLDSIREELAELRLLSYLAS